MSGPNGPLIVISIAEKSDRTDVLCLVTLRATRDLELDGLTFFE
jgi:hypothetical protein